jgi:hypothetical protein
MASPTVNFRHTYTDEAPYTKTYDYDTRTDGQPVYIGYTEPSNAKSETRWQIRKLTYSASGFITDIQWAGGSAAFAFEWDERAGYTYS